MVDQESVPKLHQVVLDCTDARSLAEFYRQFLGLVYRPGDEPPEGHPSQEISDESQVFSHEADAGQTLGPVVERVQGASFDVDIGRGSWPG